MPSPTTATRSTPRRPTGASSSVPALVVGLADEYDLLTEVGTPDGGLVSQDEALGPAATHPGRSRGPPAGPRARALATHASVARMTRFFPRAATCPRAWAVLVLGALRSSPQRSTPGAASLRDRARAAPDRPSCSSSPRSRSVSCSGCGCRAVARPRRWRPRRRWPLVFVGRSRRRADLRRRGRVRRARRRRPGCCVAAVRAGRPGPCGRIDQVAARLVGVGVGRLARPRRSPPTAQSLWDLEIDPRVLVVAGRRSAWWPWPASASPSRSVLSSAVRSERQRTPWLAALRDEFGEVAPLTYAVVASGPDGRPDGARAGAARPCPWRSSRWRSPTSPSAATSRTG